LNEDEVHLTTEAIFVVYRATDGGIVTIHSFLSHEGAPRQDEDALAGEALAAAAEQHDIPHSEIAAIKARPEDVEKAVAYKVDTERRVLVPRG